MGMRIGGLASGMDIDSIVAKLMDAERAPLKKFQQQKQTYEWQRDALRTINKNSNTLRTSLFDMTLKSNMIKKSVTSTNDAVTAKANSDATGTLQISKVSQLATSATIKSEGIFEEGTASNTKLSESDVTSHLFANQDTVDIKMKVMKDNGKMEDVSISISKDDTIATMVSKLNKSDTGLNAYYDQQSGSLSISTKATGLGKVYESVDVAQTTASTVKTDTHSVEVDTSMYVDEGLDFFSALGFNNTKDLTDTTSGFANPDSVSSAGSNAVLEYNGLRLERSSNTFNLNGYEITLNKTYNEASPITLKATTDVDHFIKQAEDFVNKYNEFIKSTHGAINETKNRNYQPLTEEDKEGMSEEEIEKWEKTAKSGVIRRDSTVQQGLQNLRSIIYSNAGSTGKNYDTLSEIGITTTKNYNDGGLLELDKDQLRKALIEDEEAVFKVFSNDVEGEPKGAIQQIRTTLEKFEHSIEVKAGKESAAADTFTIGRNLNNVDKRISTWEAKLKIIEDRYWSQFTAMEKAINKANEQSSTLFSGQAQ